MSSTIERSKLDADIESFLAKGGKIKKCPTALDGMKFKLAPEVYNRRKQENSAADLEPRLQQNFTAHEFRTQSDSGQSVSA